MRIIVLAVVLLFLFPVAVISADNAAKSSATENKADKKAREKSARGEVKVVDPAARILIIVGKDEVAFIADESLLQDVRLNDQVTVKYTERDGKKTLSSIKVDSKQKGKKKAEKKAEASKPADK